MALRGLTEATQRLHEANRRIVTGGGGVPVTIALGEALWWTSALDDFFTKAEGKRVYHARREADERGRTVGGLVFARNMLGHGLNTASAIDFHLPSPTIVREGNNVTVRWARLSGREYADPDRGTIFRIEMRWADLSELPTPTGPQHKRDEWYVGLIAGRPLTGPLDVAAEWFRTELAGPVAEAVS
jgi:hypothetical protein